MKQTRRVLNYLLIHTPASGKHYEQYRYPRNRTFSTYRYRYLSSFATSVSDWLSKKGYSEEERNKLIKSLQDTNMQPTISLLESMGDAGLKAYLESIHREERRFALKTNRKTVTVNIQIPQQNKSLRIDAKEGDTLMDCALANKSLGTYLECACGGISACSTCHVYIDNKESYSMLDPPEEAELDMVDLAAGTVQGKSRLGCQVVLNSKSEGTVFRIPVDVNNLYGK